MLMLGMCRNYANKIPQEESQEKSKACFISKILLTRLQSHFIDTVSSLINETFFEGQQKSKLFLTSKFLLN